MENNNDDFVKKKITEILIHYRKGRTINYIAEEVKLPVSYVKHLLLFYKEQSRVNKRLFNQEFKRIVAERYQNDVDRKTISKELKISKTLISTSNSQYEFHEKRCKYIRNYELYSTYILLDRCPFCNSLEINKIKTIAEVVRQDGTMNCCSTEGICCKVCGNEFFYFAKDNDKDIYVITDDIFVADE